MPHQQLKCIKALSTKPVKLDKAAEMAYYNQCFPVDLNHASLHEMMWCLGLGYAEAHNIVSFRQRNGKFIDPSELTKAGISRQRYSCIRHHIFCGEVSRETHGKMTRQTYRRHHEDEIEDIKWSTGENPDVCHIISGNNRGANDEDNFILAGASFNRSIQDKDDELMCYYAAEHEGIEKVKRAIRASRLQKDCRLTVDDAVHIVEQGRKKVQQYQEEDEYDEWDAEESYDESDSDYCEWT